MTDTAIQNTIFDGSLYDPDIRGDATGFENETPYNDFTVKVKRLEDNGALITYTDRNAQDATLFIAHNMNGAMFEFSASGPRNGRANDQIIIDRMLQYYELTLKYNNWPR